MNILPKKSLGQNFLINKNIIKNIVDYGEVNSNDIVIEIGPGTGNLSEEIIEKKPKKFYAIEKDENLCLKLKEKFKSNINVINQDVLQINWDKFLEERIIVFGNLPYNISAKILIEWIRLNNLNNLFCKLILMFQKEVADRIVAEVNSKEYGRLSILTNWKMTAKKIMDLGPENFFPIPKIKSSLVYFEPKIKYFKFENSINLEKVTNIFFQNKRKMIKKPLNILFKNPKKIINRLDLDEKCRPQNLDPLIFYKITKEFETETD